MPRYRTSIEKWLTIQTSTARLWWEINSGPFRHSNLNVHCWDNGQQQAVSVGAGPPA